MVEVFPGIPSPLENGIAWYLGQTFDHYPKWLPARVGVDNGET